MVTIDLSQDNWIDVLRERLAADFTDDGTVGIEDVCPGSLIRLGDAFQLVWAKRYEPDGSVVLGLSEWHAVPARMSWYPVSDGERFQSCEPF